jgi:hypothetical protein
VNTLRHQERGKPSDSYVRAAIWHAWVRWYWSDDAMIRELCEASGHMHRNPAELIDAYARKYDLTDPREVMP